MAITIESQPYSFTARGQRLMFIATSDNTGELQFKYGVKITAGSTGQVLQFLVTPDIDGKLIFDLQSVVKLRNDDTQDGWHSYNFFNRKSRTHWEGRRRLYGSTPRMVVGDASRRSTDND